MTNKEREAHERGYLDGNNAAYRELLRTAIRGLGQDDPQADAERWRIERAETVAMLRQICEVHGDNDWPDTLHLADVIEKHLWRNLPELEAKVSQ